METTLQAGAVASSHKSHPSLAALLCATAFLVGCGGGASSRQPVLDSDAAPQPSTTTSPPSTPDAAPPPIKAPPGWDSGPSEADAATDAPSATDASPETQADSAPPPGPSDAATCPTGTTSCDAICVDPATDPDNCGACANVCPSIANATATCTASQCGVACNADYHECGGVCASNASVATCGASCSPCPAVPANATATCNGVACGFACNAGYHVCQSACCLDVLSVAVGGDETCAVTSAGTTLCWGYNAYGQLGDDSTVNSDAPALVSGLAQTSASLAVGGDHACAVSSLGGLSCWGDDGNGQLGDNSTTSKLLPASIYSGGASAVAAGNDHTCLLSNGNVMCWGYNNAGQLGDGTTTDSHTPVMVNTATSVAALAAGGLHTCALTSAGGVLCWGANGEGQVGNATMTNTNVPVEAYLLHSGVAAIAAGGFHTCAALEEGGVDCWGYNSSGQLGDGTTNNSSVPVAVSGLNGTTVVSLAAGNSHTCALTAGGAVLCWGDDLYGELGDAGASGGSSPTPVFVVGLGAGVVAVAASGDSLHTCAIVSDGDLQCWGGNPYGELGTGNLSESKVAVSVQGL
jgi:alpha-tubulin suppressor-like RCC1 family protein